jgi:hypothetical protein
MEQAKKPRRRAKVFHYAKWWRKYEFETNNLLIVFTETQRAAIVNKMSGTCYSVTWDELQQCLEKAMGQRKQECLKQT